MPELPHRNSGEPFTVAHAPVTDEQIAMHALKELVRMDTTAATWAAENLAGIVGHSVLDRRAAELLQRMARDV